MKPTNSITPLDLMALASKTGNIYKSLVVLSKRAVQIGQQQKEELNEKLAEFATHSDVLEEVVENREQIEIAKYYEAQPKPTQQAIAELMNDETHIEDPDIVV